MPTQPEQTLAIQRRLVDPRTMSFGDHLEELRRRLWIALAGVIPIFAVSLYLGKSLLHLLVRPAQQRLIEAGQPPFLQATGPIETFGCYFKLAAIATIIVALPWIFWQIWKFVQPGLYQHERRFARVLIPLSLVLSALGVGFMYYAMLPAILTFLINFGTGIGRVDVETAPLAPGTALPQMVILDKDPPEPPAGSFWFNSTLKELRFAKPVEGGFEVLGTPLTRNAGIVQQYRVSEYVDMVFFMGLAFAIGFQMPVIVLLLGWIGVVDRAFLIKNRRYAVFLCAVAAALLTPSPDPFSMLLLAVPLYGLYELGVFLLRFVSAERVARGFQWGKEPADAGDA